MVYGARHGYEEIVKSALKDGADINADNDYALSLAAEDGNTETVRLLSDEGAKIHVDNDAALRLAADNGHTETVKVLLDRGASIHADNDSALYSQHIMPSGRPQAALRPPSGRGQAEPRRAKPSQDTYRDSEIIVSLRSDDNTGNKRNGKTK